MWWRGTFTHHRTQSQLTLDVEAGNRFKARQELWRELARVGATDPTREAWSLDGPTELEPAP